MTDYATFTTSALVNALDEDGTIEHLYTYRPGTGTKHVYVHNGVEYAQSTRKTRDHLLSIVSERVSKA